MEYLYIAGACLSIAGMILMFQKQTDRHNRELFKTGEALNKMMLVESGALSESQSYILEKQAKAYLIKSS